MSLPRILFVDDETQVLAGLRNMLRKERHRWEMVFAAGGQAALDELAKGPFDLLVSDMRMPGIDGAALLDEVKHRYPAVARIILSGHSERESVLRSLPVAQQFLAKPCSGDVLRAVIERACELRRLVGNDALREMVGTIDRLPSLPSTYLALTGAHDGGEAELAELATIIGRDPAMSAKVVQLVNSAYFGLPRRVTSVQEAVACLGVEMLKALTLSASVFATTEWPMAEGLSLEQFHAHALLVARVARRMAAGSGREDAAFTAGLLHDVGEAVLAVGRPREYAALAAEAQASGRSLHAVEKERLGTSHAEVGACLLGLWGLPTDIVDAVAHHHDPGAAAAPAADLVALVHVASHLAAEVAAASSATDTTGIDHAFLEQLDLASRLPAWRALAHAEVATAQADQAAGRQ